MTIAFCRRAAFVLAALLPLAAAPLALGQNGRVLAVQDNPELKKRADALFHGVAESGGKVSYGALEAGAGAGGVGIKQNQIGSKGRKEVRNGSHETKSSD